MNNDINEKIVHAAPVPPFVRFVASAVPMVFDNSLSYYEALCALWKWLQDDVINVINNNATVTEHYIEMDEETRQLFIELKSYVDNYFDNLDVQEEINNKLDDMTEAGTLQEIITAYIQSNVAWTFDTVADMKAAANLIAGSYAQTLGFHTINDGGGATYLISDSGTANGMDVIAVGSLYANLVQENTITPEKCGATGDGTTNDSSAFLRACTICKNVICKNSYVISDITIPNGTFISGKGTLIPSSVTIGADTTIKDMNVSIESGTAFIINNLGETSNNNDLFDGLTCNCSGNSTTLFFINPTQSNAGLSNVRFNNITVKGNYGYFLHSDNNSKWVTAITIANTYVGSPVNAVLNDNDVDSVSYFSCTMINVKSQANSHTEHFIVTDASKMFLYGCGVDEILSYSYKMIYIRNAKCKILVDGITTSTNLVGASVYSEYTALVNNIFLTNVVDSVPYNQFQFTETSNAGTMNGGSSLGVGSISSLSINSKRLLGMQITPGNRVAVDGRSFFIGVDASGIPYYASVSGNEYHEIPYTGKLKTYSTADRPASANNGDCIFDTTLKQPIYWYGRWLKYDGTNA